MTDVEDAIRVLARQKLTREQIQKLVDELNTPEFIKQLEEIFSKATLVTNDGWTKILDQHLEKKNA